MARERFGEYLLRQGVLTREAVSAILDEQRVAREEFGCLAVRRGYLEEEQMIEYLAAFLGMPVFDLAAISPEPKLVSKIPKKMALKLGLFPLGKGENGEFICACAGPVNMAALQSVGRLVNRPVKLQLVSQPRLKKMQNEQYSRQFDTSIKVSQVVAGDDDLHMITELLEKLLLRAINLYASDIHIEPGKEELTIRFRVDGMLAIAESLPTVLADKIITRIKVLSGLDIAEKRMPQDGSFFFQPQRLDVEIDGVNIRTSTLPVVWGEKAVMRILPSNDSAVAIGALGMEEDTLKLFKKQISAPHGIILVTGATG
ncbi:MAG: Flp pilus assembly complex ATPase component TadA, partial [Desulfobulbaceae bacterium]|nr:Flp pilus assembly complex ATPase component TadA [Desulfobulbaceae bacterium]